VDEVIWKGQEPVYATAVSTALGVLLDLESATTAVIRTGGPVAFLIADGDTELTITLSPRLVQVRRQVRMDLVGLAVTLLEVESAQIRTECHTLLNRIQVRQIDSMRQR
jgi:hypothetical protein